MDQKWIRNSQIGCGKLSMILSSSSKTICVECKLYDYWGQYKIWLVKEGLQENREA